MGFLSHSPPSPSPHTTTKPIIFIGAKFSSSWYCFSWIGL
jgi:hypothetical protein